MTVHSGTGLSALRRRVHDLMPAAHTDLARLVAFPSVADRDQFPATGCRDAVRYLIDAFGAAGLREVAAYDTPDGSQAVYGHVPGPAGTPTVLLYCHYDVQPPLGEDAWHSPPFELTERDGRWYGRGSADCKGNIVAHLTALRAFDGEPPAGVKVIAEGSEEQGTGGLEDFARRHPDLLRADAILVCDAGNLAPGVPTLTTTLRGLANVVVTVRTLHGPVHSGMFGGPAPDALAALVRMLDSLRDETGATAIRGLAADRTWDGAPYPEDRFRADAGVLDGVDLLGDATVADGVWARPAVTVLGIDCPPVVGSSASVPAEARARIGLRVPPGMDATAAQDALIAHLHAAAPWQVRVEVDREAVGEPFRGDATGRAYAAMRTAMELAFAAPLQTQGQGGSIPLCNALREIYPDTEIMIMGVEDPGCLMHAPNESVLPDEIERIALAEALFLTRYAS